MNENIAKNNSCKSLEISQKKLYNGVLSVKSQAYSVQTATLL